MDGGVPSVPRILWDGSNVKEPTDATKVYADNRFEIVSGFVGLFTVSFSTSQIEPLARYTQDTSTSLCGVSDSLPIPSNHCSFTG